MKKSRNWLQTLLFVATVCLTSQCLSAGFATWRDNYVRKCIENLKGEEWTNVQDLAACVDMTAITRKLCVQSHPAVSNQLSSLSVQPLIDQTKAKLGFCEFVDNGVSYGFAAWKTALIERPVYLSAVGMSLEDTDPVSFVKHVLNLDAHCYLMRGLPNEELADGYLVRGKFSGREYVSPFESGWFYFVDDKPFANWSHPCRYVFVSADRSAYVVVYSNEPPTVFSDGKEIDLSKISTNVQKADNSLSIKQFRNSVNASAVNTVDFSGDTSHSYAVLISGGGDKDSNYSRYWGDVAMIYSTLTLKYGIPKANIRVCMSDGTSTATDMYNTNTEAYEDSPKDLDGDDVADIGYDAKKATIKSVLDTLSSSLTSEDQLFIFITDHGAQSSSTGISYLVPWLDGNTGVSAYISPTELSAWIATFQCPVAVAMEYCYSGPFISPIVQTANRAVGTACGDEPSSAFCWSDPTGTLSGAIVSGAFDYCNPYAWAFNSAIRGADSLWSFTPWYDASDSQVGSADSNGDGKISFYEAAKCAENYILNTTKTYQSTVLTFCDTPQYGESTSGFGATFYIAKQSAGASVPTIPAAPSSVSLSGLTLSWSPVSGATHYRVYRTTSCYGEPVAYKGWQTSCSCTVEQPTTPGIYYYSVKAASGADDSKASDLSSRVSTRYAGKGDFKWVSVPASGGSYTIFSSSKYPRCGSTVTYTPYGSYGSGGSASVTHCGTTKSLASTATFSEPTSSLLIGQTISASVTFSNNTTPFGRTWALRDWYENNTGAVSPASGMIAVLAAEVYYYDQRGQYTVSTSTGATTVDAEGGLGSASVTAALGTSWSVSCDKTWVSLARTTGEASGTVAYLVEPNNDAARTATITFKASGSTSTATVTVNQSAGASAPVTYTVTYAPGSNGTGSQQTATKTQNVAMTLAGALFTRTGYTQTGWATTDGGAKVYALGGTYTANAAVTLYPYWTANTYTVTYSPGSYGTGSQQTATKTYGTSLTLKGAIFTRSGYMQTGWATSDGGAKAYALYGTYTANAAITLYPVWTVNIAATTALDNLSLTFTTGGSASWYGQTSITHDGVDAMRSGPITHSQSTWMQTTVTGPGTVSFWWYASSEGASYDYLYFNIDDVQTNKIGGTSCSWTQCSYHLPEGSHTLKWTYRKDGSYDYGEDAGFVDQVVWTDDLVAPTAPVISSVSTAYTSYAKVTWGVVSGATSYNVYRSTTSTQPSSAYASGITTSYYYDYGATPGVTYYYWVEAVNSAGSAVSAYKVGYRAVLLSLGSTAQNFVAAGGSTNVSVSANTSWTASASDSWVTLSTSSGSSNGTLSYTVAENTLTTSRSGTITVTAGGSTAHPKTVTITVTQEAIAQATVPDLAFAIFSGWSEHGFALFTSQTNTGMPVRVFEKGAGFSVIHGFANFGDGDAVGPFCNLVEISDEEGVVYSTTSEFSGTYAKYYGSSSGLTATAWTNYPAGLYLARVELDTDDDVEESNESNNENQFVFAIRDSVSLNTALDNTSLTFTSSGTNDWYGTKGYGCDGVDCVASLHKGDNGTNDLKTTVSGPGTISFNWRVSSERNYDKLQFLIDGVVTNFISGTGSSWTNCQCEIPSGSHQLAWRYVKDSSYYSGFDCGWIDQVVWTPTVTLSSISIAGKASVPGENTTKYVCTATYSDGSSVTVTPTWSVDSGSAYASINSSGVLTTSAVSSSQTAVIRASYGGKTATKSVTVFSTVATGTALDNSSLTFTTGGSANWYGQTSITHDGVDAMRSGPITHNQSTWMQTSVTGPGTISFWWYASSESTSWDYLYFSIDGVSTNIIGGTSCSWTQCSYHLPEGSHTLKWTYRKDGSYDYGEDAGFVDQIVWADDPVAPTAPVISSVSTAYTSYVKVTWGAVSGATSYNVYRSTSATRPSSAYASGITTSYYYDYGATPGVTYYYWVEAANSAGSAVSAYESGYRAVLLSLGSTAQNFVAAGGSTNVSVSANTSWTASASDSWITLSTSSGASSGTLSYTVAENTLTTSRSGTITVTAGGSTSHPKTVTISVIQAQAVLQTYTVTYAPGSNGTGSQQTATKTQGVALPLAGAIFTRSGYTQTGWATSDGGAQAYALGASYTTNASITLYPYWTKTAVELEAISIVGPVSVIGVKTISYKCMALYSDQSVKVVSPKWSLLSGTDCASLNSAGTLTTTEVLSLSSIAIQAVYDDDGVAKSIVKNISLLPSNSTVWYVDASATGNTKDGMSWDTAYTSIQSAVSSASDGQYVLVADGIYSPIRSQGKKIVISSVNGSSTTIIDPKSKPGTSWDNTGILSCAWLNETITTDTAKWNLCTNSVLRGITLRNGCATNWFGCGGGVFGGRLVDCVITGCVANSQGGGACCSVLERCRVVGNRAYAGGGMSQCNAVECDVSENLASGWSGAGAFSGSLYRCRVYDNIGTSTDDGCAGGGVAYAEVVKNCIVYGNKAWKGAGLYNVSRVESCTICNNEGGYGSGMMMCGSTLNSIIWGNVSTEKGSVLGCASISYSCVDDTNCTGVGLIYDDPAFNDVECRDYSLDTTSPCCDAGYVPSNSGELDFSGSPRIQGTAPDMGALETPDEIVVEEKREPVTWYVDAVNGGDENEGLCQSDALASLQQAVLLAKDGDQIIVFPGTYDPIVTVDKRILIESSAGAEQTFISGGDTLRCADMGTTTNTTIRGFTFCEGDALKGGGIYFGTAENCIIRDNASNDYLQHYSCDGKSYGLIEGNGGGCYGGILYNCVITNNYAENGGGGFQVTLYNCLVAGNTATSGSGIYSSRANNCTFGKNYSYYQHAVYCSTLTNCIVWGNSSGYSSGNYQGEVFLGTAHHCCIKSGYGVSKTGITVTNDPEFVAADKNDFQLQISSPCIDAGDNNVWHSDRDLAGGARVIGEAIDIGAYEYCSISCLVFYEPGEFGTGTQQTVIKTNGVAMVLADALFTRAGYTQTGWATSDGGTQAYALGETYTEDAAITLYPVWTPVVTKVADPVITAAGGTTFETETCSVSITCATPGASIYYRTDGGTPRPTSKYLYTGAFTISETSEIVAFAVKDGLEDSEFVTLTVTKVIREPLTLAKALEIPSRTVTTGGDADWQPVESVAGATNETAAKSGAIAPEQETWMKLTVSGKGTISFRWRGDCEADPRGRYTYDCGAFDIGGEVKSRIDGSTDWRTVSATVDTAGEHVFTWTYSKDDYDEDDYDGGDCIWVDNVVWTPVGSEPIPTLPDNPTAADVAEALAGAMDTGLGKNITTPEKYNDFRDWAGKVKATGSGTVAGLQAVQDSPYAWLSYALAADTLIATLPSSDDVAVETFEPTAIDGTFDFTVSVGGVSVGSSASAENLKQVFGLEGGSSPDALSSDAVTITFGTPVDGKVRFTAGPKDTSKTSFFMRVKMTP